MRKLVLVLAMLAAVVGAAFAGDRSDLVADLGDVRIYSLGGGYFEVDSDRVQQCFSLNFRQSGGWVEIACSSTVQKVAPTAIDLGVKQVVTSYLGKDRKWAGIVAGKVANWATRQGLDYLCN